MSHKKNSGWNDINEIRCFIILKKLQESNYQGKFSRLSQEMSNLKDVNLLPGTIRMKVSNFKYLLTDGKEGLSSYSKDTKRIYEKYRKHSIGDLEKNRFDKRI